MTPEAIKVLEELLGRDYGLEAGYPFEFDDGRTDYVLKSLKSMIFQSVARKYVDHSGSALVPVPDLVTDTIRLANRMCRFVLNDKAKTHIGTGFLVGPDCVLTAAHLFFHDDAFLIDANRRTRVKVEFERLLMGTSFVASANSTRIDLKDDETEWLVDPPLIRQQNAGTLRTTRDVRALDYAIVRLSQKVGYDALGEGETRTRGWFQILPPDETPTVAVGSMIKILQYVDRGNLRQSLGYVTRISADRTRLFYTASTLDAASGSAVLDDKSRLVAVHTGGAEEVGLSENRGMPIIRAATMLGDRLSKVSPPIENDRPEKGYGLKFTRSVQRRASDRRGSRRTAEDRSRTAPGPSGVSEAQGSSDSAPRLSSE